MGVRHGGQEGWRRQGKRMGQGGGDPSLQQGQEILLVLHAEVGRQVLTARGSHCSSHQQLPGSLLVQLGPEAQPCQPTGSAVCRRHPQVGHVPGGSCLCSPRAFPFPRCAGGRWLLVAGWPRTASRGSWKVRGQLHGNRIGAFCYKPGITVRKTSPCAHCGPVRWGRSARSGPFKQQEEGWCRWGPLGILPGKVLPPWTRGAGGPQQSKGPCRVSNQEGSPSTPGFIAAEVAVICSITQKELQSRACPHPPAPELCSLK